MYVSKDQFISDVEDLADFLKSQGYYSIAADIEAKSQYVLLPDFAPGLGEDIITPYQPLTDLTTNVPGINTTVSPTVQQPSILSLINSLGTTISAASNRAAMSAQDYYTAKMKIDAMRAQANAGFLAQPVAIGAQQPMGFNMNPTTMLLIGGGLLAVLMLSK